MLQYAARFERIPTTFFSRLRLQRQRDLVCRYRAFADNHPRVWTAAEVDDGRRGGPRRRSAVDDERDLIAELLQYGFGVGAFGSAAEVGGSCGDRQAELLYNCAADGRFRDAQRNVAGVRSDA